MKDKRSTCPGNDEASRRITRIIPALGYTRTHSYMNIDHLGFTPKELRKLRSLKDPHGIQKHLDAMPYHLADPPGPRAGCWQKIHRTVWKAQFSRRPPCAQTAFPHCWSISKRSMTPTTCLPFTVSMDIGARLRNRITLAAGTVSPFIALCESWRSAIQYLFQFASRANPAPLFTPRESCALRCTTLDDDRQAGLVYRVPPAGNSSFQPVQQAHCKPSASGGRAGVSGGDSGEGIQETSVVGEGERFKPQPTLAGEAWYPRHLRGEAVAEPVRLLAFP